MNKYLTTRFVTFFAIGCFTLASLYAGLVFHHDASALEAQTQMHKKAHMENVARARQREWQGHLQREAWDKAHPTEAKRRKALAREAAFAKAQAEMAARKKRAIASAAAQAQANRQRAESDKWTHACETADALERRAADYVNAHNYQSAYDTSVSGLRYNDACDSENTKLVNKAYFMSFKGFSEHYLSSGDSRTDLNEANQLLVECQTTPGLYGTHVAAQCETQESSNISWTTHWDMNE